MGSIARAQELGIDAESFRAANAAAVEIRKWSSHIKMNTLRPMAEHVVLKIILSNPNSVVGFAEGADPVRSIVEGAGFSYIE